MSNIDESYWNRSAAQKVCSEDVEPPNSTTSPSLPSAVFAIRSNDFGVPPLACGSGLGDYERGEFGVEAPETG